MKDLIDFVQIPGSVTMIDQTPHKLEMIDDDDFHFSNTDGKIRAIRGNNIRTATYHGDGIFRVRNKIGGQTVSIHMVEVYNGEERQKIQTKQTKQSGS